MAKISVVKNPPKPSWNDIKEVTLTLTSDEVQAVLALVGQVDPFSYGYQHSTTIFTFLKDLGPYEERKYEYVKGSLNLR